MDESDLRRAILCGRAATWGLDGQLITACPGDCIAHLLRWAGMYLTPLRTRHGWATPSRGDLGQGWPDLVLVQYQGQGRRLVYAELKSDDGRMTSDQRHVAAILRAAGQEVYLWRPPDLDDGTIWRLLQGPRP